MVTERPGLAMGDLCAMQCMAGTYSDDNVVFNANEAVGSPTGYKYTLFVC